MWAPRQLPPLPVTVTLINRVGAVRYRLEAQYFSVAKKQSIQIQAGFARTQDLDLARAIHVQSRGARDLRSPNSSSSSTRPAIVRRPDVRRAQSIASAEHLRQPRGNKTTAAKNHMSCSWFGFPWPASLQKCSSIQKASSFQGPFSR